MKAIRNVKSVRLKLYNNIDSKIIAEFDCMYESGNGLKGDEAGYDEYHAIGFINLDTNELFEVN